jgi:2-polyprenyl-6-methoxyphenol hydroxylase-like FAD-dependent oxidoreductase
MKPFRVVIAGGGPAGMMMAYQLASNGVQVAVLERHPDFDREFRGELLQRPVLERLEDAGLMRLLLERGLALPGIERRMLLGTSRTVRVPGPVERGAIVSQPGMLAVLHQLCIGYPGYAMHFGTTVLDAVQEDGRVVALRTRRGGVEERIDADLFLVCNGRNSHLRKSCGLVTKQYETTADALWLRFDFADAPALLPTTLDVQMFGKGRVVVLQPTTGNRLHIAYSEPGDLRALHQDLPELRRRLLQSLPASLRPHIGRKLDERTAWQALKIIVDRVERWHAPGVLFLGDAAHTMSPAGGQGLNLAIRDTFVAANHILSALEQDRPVDAAVLQEVQDERTPEIDAIQAAQTRAGRMVLKPLPALHVMFSMLAVAMKLFGKRMQSAAPGSGAAPRYLTKIR